VRSKSDFEQWLREAKQAMPQQGAPAPGQTLPAPNGTAPAPTASNAPADLPATPAHG
jgi:hypothetical protein